MWNNFLDLLIGSDKEERFRSIFFSSIGILFIIGLLIYRYLIVGGN